jgi:cellulose synthase/poly-beta-1,6-N-acetylglucosamine synthase-like glycosyltransferase
MLEFRYNSKAIDIMFQVQLERASNKIFSVLWHFHKIIQNHLMLLSYEATLQTRKIKNKKWRVFDNEWEWLAHNIPPNDIYDLMGVNK